MVALLAVFRGPQLAKRGFSSSRLSAVIGTSIHSSINNCHRSTFPHLHHPSSTLNTFRGLSQSSRLHYPVRSISNHPTPAMAINVEQVLAGKYPAKEHARRVAQYMKKTTGVIYLEGQKTTFNEDNDGEAHFRQRRYFYYLSGCEVPDCALAYDIAADTLTLFVPPVDQDSVIWSGLPLSEDEALTAYDIDQVRTMHEVNPTLSASKTKDSVFAIAGQVSDEVTFLPFETTDLALVKNAIEECRVLKDDYEVALTRKANMISTIAHTEVMKRVKKATNERELYAAFVEKCISNGAGEQAYHSIVASGTAGATLHYVKNNQPLAGKLNILLDAGGEYNCYASDITRCFPINGKFTKESREIYDIVLKMQEVSISMLKAGVHWDDVHLAAHKVAIEGLLELGILQGDKEDILKTRTSVAFFPHGLGHFLGMDTHDTGGHPNYEDKDAMFRYLRVRLPLPARSIITVEPGIYFCRFIIEPYLSDPIHSPYINFEVLNKYWDVGGIRIEDNILITETGYENLTDTPKSVEEMEAIINSA